MKNFKSINGFTLIELSIVLAIIGLIISGIISGQKIVRNAQIQRILRDYDKYKTAIMVFKGQYEQLPGDIDNAYTYWGSNCAASNSDCNGDGNGSIQYSNSYLDDETLRMWQHLSLSGILSETYSGTGSTIGGGEVKAGYNVPQSGCPACGFAVSYTQSFGFSEQGMMYGKEYPGSWQSSGAVTPAEAYAIDKKIDDGNAGTGKLFTIRGDDFFGNSTACIDKDYNGTTPVTYILSDPKTSCRLMLWLFKLS